MASIFTYDSEPPRVLSPWPQSSTGRDKNGIGNEQDFPMGMEMPPVELLADYGIGKLGAEPQEGPTEYKLHLLLRPRRKFLTTSTVQKVSGSHSSRVYSVRPMSEESASSQVSTTPQNPSSLSRQNRLQHLTTQLLWRLQQSSPFHSASETSSVLPVLPEADVECFASEGPGKLLPGLEESQGALYEIGVSDDGTFVGLLKDELMESLMVLRSMAFSLGCNIQILRLVIVGDCQWVDEGLQDSDLKKTKSQTVRKEKLLVAEVLVTPDLAAPEIVPSIASLSLDSCFSADVEKANEQRGTEPESQSEQLRVTLTGSTTSGKSSLLGTLSTSTPDNGRGKSRLSLLKHRHEIVSGVTSSLAQELLGYQNVASSNATLKIQIINYASGNVSSWNDIHSASVRGRLIFMTDSAGHPRYRRTTIRGLVSWASHWTICCIAADDGESSNGRIGATATSTEILGSAGAGVDLSKAHLDLCLKLQLPLILVITKLDIATKVGLRNTLTKVLTILKSAGRKPTVVSSFDSNSDDQLQSISADDREAARKAINSVDPDEIKLLVPIVLTSAVSGKGIGELHALLHQLPLVVDRHERAFLQNTRPSFSLFHIDEVFTTPSSSHTVQGTNVGSYSILSGYLRYGTLEVGEKYVVGPCSSEVVGEMVNGLDSSLASSFPSPGKGLPRAASLSYDRRRPFLDDFAGSKTNSDDHTEELPCWQEVRISSLRNLRLPVRKLTAGQVGTVGICLFDAGKLSADTVPPKRSSYIRRGMVLMSVSRSPSHHPFLAYTRFCAVFQEASLPAWPGVLVTVYVASIRASAKIVRVKALEDTSTTEDIFDFDDYGSGDSNLMIPDSPTSSQRTEIVFEFATSQEWVEVGTQVLVTPGGGPSLTGQPEPRDFSSAGLNGYVGTITEAFV